MKLKKISKKKYKIPENEEYGIPENKEYTCMLPEEGIHKNKIIHCDIISWL